jgi:hypothetical protein
VIDRKTEAGKLVRKGLERQTDKTYRKRDSITKGKMLRKIERRERKEVRNR